MINLQVKLAKYLDLKKQYEDSAYEEEIARKVEEYRLQLISEHTANLAKINHYIELLLELLKEAADEEIVQVNNSVNSEECENNSVINDVVDDVDDSNIRDFTNN